ncbi:MAG TPA: FtsX-like permease family protein, partial [Vicinamibacterales bacterium]|nr:FtsX-like permease family protein [Vicinamibacterales bacterium]
VNVQQPSARNDSPERITGFTDRVLEELTAAPGVAAAAAAWPLEYVGFNWAPHVNLHETPFPDGQEPPVRMSAVTPAYFETMGIRLKQGRVFEARDRLGAPVAAVVSETFVRQLMPDVDPLGRRIKAVGIPELADMHIVGVVGSTHRRGPAGSVFPEVYCAFAQFPLEGATFVVRAASGDPLRLAAIVEDRVADVDGEIATFGVRRLADAVRDTVGDRRALAALLSLFAGLALAMTALGIAGIVSYVVAQRTTEIGVRMALGARPESVVALVLRDAFVPVAAGLAAGAVAAVPVARTIRSLLFEVTPWDPVAVGGAAAVLLLAALTAAYVPARRATRIDPLVALRGV